MVAIKVFTILISISLSTHVLAAPVQPEATVSWASLKNEPSLKRFHSTLLNETKLTFLDECYKDVALLKGVPKILCALYFDGVRQLNETYTVVNQPVIEELVNNSGQDKEFCRTKQGHTYPPVKYYPTSTKSVNLNDIQMCSSFCMEFGEGSMVSKPICELLSWMGEQIKGAHTEAPAPVAVANVTTSATKTAEVEAGIKKAVVADRAKMIEIEAAKPGQTNSASATNDQAKQPVQEHPSSLPQQVIPKAPVVVAPKVPEPQENYESAPAAPLAPSAAETPNTAEKPNVAEKPNIMEKPESNEEPKDLAPPKSPPKEDQAKSPPVQQPVDTQDEAQLKGVLTNPGKADSVPLDSQLPNEEQQFGNESDEDNINEEENPDDDDMDEPNPNSQKHNQQPPIENPGSKETDQQKSQEIIGNSFPVVTQVASNLHVTDPFLEESGSNFFTYFLIGMFLCIVLYVVYHNKSKILALLLEGRRSDKGRGGRRKHTAAYRKLDSNLEEAITSSASGRTTQIIY